MIIKALIGSVVIIVVAAIIYRVRLLSSGLLITSQWRSPFNDPGAKEGEPIIFSMHQLGWAFDVAPATDDVAQQLSDMGFRFVLNEGSHIHAEII